MLSSAVRRSTKTVMSQTRVASSILSQARTVTPNLVATFNVRTFVVSGRRPHRAGRWPAWYQCSHLFSTQATNDTNNLHRSNAEHLVAQADVIFVDAPIAVCDGGSRPRPLPPGARPLRFPCLVTLTSADVLM